MTYDMHIHTDYCGHAVGMNVDAILRRADELALDTIAITDHVFRRQDLAIIEQIAAEVKRARPRCRVIVGAEVDVDGFRADGRLVTDELDDIDYVIAGFHYVPTVGNYPHRPEDCPLKPERFFKVWRSSLLGIVSNPPSTRLPPRRLSPHRSISTSGSTPSSLFAGLLSVPLKRHRMEINELRPALTDAATSTASTRSHSMPASGSSTVPMRLHQIAGDAFARHILKDLPADALAKPDDILNL